MHIEHVRLSREAVTIGLVGAIVVLAISASSVALSQRMEPLSGLSGDAAVTEPIPQGASGAAADGADSTEREPGVQATTLSRVAQLALASRLVRAAVFTTVPRLIIGR